MSLNAAQLPFVQSIDGRRTIREIAACVAQGQRPGQGGVVHSEKFGRKLFQALWRLDFLAMELNPPSRTPAKHRHAGMGVRAKANDEIVDVMQARW